MLLLQSPTGEASRLGLLELSGLVTTHTSNPTQCALSPAAAIVRESLPTSLRCPPRPACCIRPCAMPGRPSRLQPAQPSLRTAVVAARICQTPLWQPGLKTMTPPDPLQHGMRISWKQERSSKLTSGSGFSYRLSSGLNAAAAVPETLILLSAVSDMMEARLQLPQEDSFNSEFQTRLSCTPNMQVRACNSSRCRSRISFCGLFPGLWLPGPLLYGLP